MLRRRIRACDRWGTSNTNGALPFFDISLQRHGVVVFLILGGVEERDDTFVRLLPDAGKLFTFVRKFSPVALLELPHFAGSCPNQCRSSFDGARSFSHRLIFALSFEMPRGQSRSIRIRSPSSSENSS